CNTAGATVSVSDASTGATGSKAVVEHPAAAATSAARSPAAPGRAPLRPRRVNPTSPARLCLRRQVRAKRPPPQGRERSLHPALFARGALFASSPPARESSWSRNLMRIFLVPRRAATRRDGSADPPLDV